MKMFVVAIIIFVTFTGVIAKCPKGMIANPSNASICYSFESTLLTYLNAEEFCQKYGGHLASIHNMFDNMFLTEQASLIFTDDIEGQFWVGGNQSESGKKWTWSDGSDFDFTDWDKGQPENLEGDNCVSAMVKYGKWHSVKCNKEKPFVCLIQILPTTTATTTTTTTKSSTVTTVTTPKPKTCPSSWTFYNQTNFCYKVFDNATWSNAEEKCKTFGGHLASVHSVDEANFLANLTFYQAPLAQCPGQYEAWIGGFTNDKNVHWNWTDGTIFDFPYWGTNEPDEPGIENCLQMLVSSNCHGRGRYNNYRCDLNDAKFICKVSPS